MQLRHAERDEYGGRKPGSYSSAASKHSASRNGTLRAEIMQRKKHDAPHALTTSALVSKSKRTSSPSRDAQDTSPVSATARHYARKNKGVTNRPLALCFVVFIASFVMFLKRFLTPFPLLFSHFDSTSLARISSTNSDGPFSNLLPYWLVYQPE